MQLANKMGKYSRKQLINISKRRHEENSINPKITLYTHMHSKGTRKPQYRRFAAKNKRNWKHN